MNKQTANNPQTPRAIAQQKYDSARANLLFMIIATVINLALLLANSDTFLLFSATVPYFSLVMAQISIEEGANVTLAYVIGGGFAAAILLLYALSWVLSKKQSGWLTLALVLFGIDTLALVALYISAEDVSGVIDLAFHVWVIYYLIIGLVNGKKLKTLPDDEPETVEAVAVAEENPSPAEVSEENEAVSITNDTEYL